MLLEQQCTSANRSFSGRVGIKTDSIIAFSDGNNTVPIFNKVTAISANGKTLTLAATTSVTGVCIGGTVATNKTTLQHLELKFLKF